MAGAPYAPHQRPFKQHAVQRAVAHAVQGAQKSFGGVHIRRMFDTVNASAHRKGHRVAAMILVHGNGFANRQCVMRADVRK